VNKTILSVNKTVVLSLLGVIGTVACAQQSGPLALRTDAVILSPPATNDLPADRGEQLTLKQAVELALRHSTSMAIAQADQKKAERGVAGLRGAFLPQVTAGSGLGYSDGFPLSLENLAPSLFNVNSSAYVVNLAQREFIKAGRHELAAMTKMVDERRAQVVYDVALTYSQLDSLENSLGSLKQQQQAASRVQTVAQQRMQAGVDSPVELTKAKLSLARVRLDMEQSQGQEELLRAHLAQLTGLPAERIVTVSDSIPALPVPVDAREFLPRAVEASHDVQVANENVLAKEAQAKGEHRSMWPAMDYALQYAALARYNNYDVYFRSSAFQRNNITAGVVIRWSLFNAPQAQRAEAADYEALKARKQAEEVKNTVTTESMKLHQSVRQLAAARDVAQLEYQLASTDVQTVQARLDAGQATVRDQQNAHLTERQRYSAYMDANFALEKSLMQLLLSTGEIESWATGGK
jgi:outer membrane protein